MTGKRKPKKPKLRIRKKLRELVLRKLGLKGGHVSRLFVTTKICEAGFVLGKNETYVSLHLRFLGKTLEEFCVEHNLQTYQASPRAPYRHLRLVSPVKPKLMPIGAPHPEYVKDTAFYDSREWKELRYLALRNTDGRCQCCGACSKDGVRIHVDHIQPRYKRPDLSLCLDNLQVLCDDCNMGKGAWDSTDWRSAKC